MDTALTLKQFRRQSWAAMLQEQAESGLTVREWCRQNSISTKGFYYRRQKVQEQIESTSVDISLDEAESSKSYEISVVTDKLSEPVTSVEETEEYKPTADVKWLREHDRSVYTYSYVYPGTRKSSSKTKKRQDYMENLAEEDMDAEGLDYDSAYEAAEED